MVILRRLFIGIIIIFPISTVFAQTRPDFLFTKLNKSKLDTNRINALVDLGLYFRKLPDRHIGNIDSCIAYYTRALQLAQQLQAGDKEMKVRSLLSGVYFIRGNAQAGRSQAFYIMDYYRRRKDLKQLAAYTDRYAEDMPAATPDEITENIKEYEEVARAYKLIHDQKGEIDAYENIAYLNMKAGRTGMAEQQYLEVIKRFNAIGYRAFRSIYNSLATMNLTKGDLKKGLEYQLKLIDNIEATGDTAHADYYYRRIGDTYYQVGMLDEALKWANRAMQFALRNKDDDYVYSVLDLQVAVLLSQYKNSEALALVQQTMKNIKPVTLDSKMAAFDNLALCYANLKQVDKAELNYLKGDSVFNVQNDDKNFGVRNKNYNNVFLHELDMAIFYYRFGKYERAKVFIAKAAAVPRGTIPANHISGLYREQYKIDSATNNYESALKYLGLYKALQDSIFNATKSKQLAALHVSYETDKKDQAIKALQMQEQQAILERNMKQADLAKVSLQRDLQKGELRQAALQRQADLQKAKLERNIQRTQLQKVSLQRKAELQKANFERNIQQVEIQRVNIQRNITFAGIAAFMVISGLAYNGYRNKKRSNEALEIKQIEINDQNTSLQNLLTEKDWLLKEVHHRVKNNLQIVMSLLSSQSAYLENTAAIEAIRESQNRVQAISLIHQKLYKSNNVASINMPAYVADLLNYLSDSFDTRKRHIKFEQLIESFNLDLAQAVPIGLILNESITNAIKYAFDEKGGQILVALQLIKDETLVLTIADNGNGFPAGFNLKNATSLGMEMMKALSKQLGGEFKVENKGGVRLSIEFQVENELSGFSEKSLISS
jgi:two-component sensor histidine kinase